MRAMAAMASTRALQSLTKTPSGTEGSGVGMWATNALIFLSIHTPICSQGFPLTKHNYKPEGRGARRMELMKTSFEGHEMEQKRWMAGLEKQVEIN